MWSNCKVCISAKLITLCNPRSRAKLLLSSLGPRQVGKTTLALDIASEQPSVYLDLERDADRQILTEPDLYLDEQAGKLVILDEVQQMPGLFKSLRGQIDQRRRAGFRAGQFLLLGSASNVLLQQSAESLAGRVRYIEMPPLQLTEVGADQLNALWAAWWLS